MRTIDYISEGSIRRRPETAVTRLIEIVVASTALARPVRQSLPAASDGAKYISASGLCSDFPLQESFCPSLFS